ncbi:hypothetical protein [Nocardioides sp. SR21]|uniref:hypothetical protein n=1 Tax=Nocardioides sp. SR21 TaxID=2919501 RepID=UPI001FAAF4B3|nr:hypothetical protein [Nocardioides sp. SR21]
MDSVRRFETSVPPEASSEYVMTGAVISAADFRVARRSRPGHGGTDVVLSVGGELVQAQVPGPASTLIVGARVAVAGEVTLIPDHEWGSFPLVDTRRRWLIADVRTLGDGEYFLLLDPAAEPAES